MFEELLTEQRNPASTHIDSVPTGQILRIMNEEDRKVADAVAAEIPQIAAAVDAIVSAIHSGGRLFYIGAGTSGRLGVLDAAECPPTFNIPSSLVQGIIAGGEQALRRSVEASEDDAGSGARDLLKHGFAGSDVLAGIAASGRTPYVLGAVRAARSCGAVTIGISCTPDSLLAGSVDIAITPLTGPEVVTGSTRLKAGTATKLVLNMLTTAAMIRLGHVYSNLMVNVQPMNEKLIDRARRIVASATGLDYTKAAEIFEQSGRSVKTAILMARKNVGKTEAEQILEEVAGRISDALDR